MIQNFLILKRSGESIYKKSFGKIDMDETIMCGFFSAFFTFTQSLCGADLRDIELGPYRILFEFVGKEIILVVFFDKSDSIINVQQHLIKLRDIIKEKYGDVIKKKVCKTEDFEGLNELIDEIILKPQEIKIKEEFKSYCESVLNDLNSTNEIIDCALISIDGIPLLRGTKREFLDLIIRQMDAFWKFKSQVLDQIILYYENRYIILYKINEDLVLSALIRRNTPIGLATLLVEEGAQKIAKQASKFNRIR